MAEHLAHKPERAREAHYKNKKAQNFQLKCCNAHAPVPAARTCGRLKVCDMATQHTTAKSTAWAAALT
jgi:hypothetical protein